MLELFAFIALCAILELFWYVTEETQKLLNYEDVLIYFILAKDSKQEKFLARNV